MHISAQEGHKDVVGMLLANGAQVDAARKVILDWWGGRLWRRMDEDIRKEMLEGGVVVV